MTDEQMIERAQDDLAAVMASTGLPAEAVLEGYVNMLAAQLRGARERLARIVETDDREAAARVRDLVRRITAEALFVRRLAFSLLSASDQMRAAVENIVPEITGTCGARWN